MKLFRLLFTLLFLTLSYYVQALETGQTIRLVNNGLSVLVENSSLEQNKHALLWKETNVNAQRWTLTAKTNGTFFLQNDYTNFYLAGLSSGNSGFVGQTNKSSANTKGSWDFVPVEGTDNQYIIYQGTTKKFALSAVADTLGSSLKIISPTNLSAADSTRIIWTVEVVEPMEKAFTKDKRDDMMEKWKARCYKKAGSGWVIGNGGWWGDAEMFEIVLDALETTGDQQYATMFENLYTNFISRNKDTWYQKGVSGYNEYNDDIAWMCIACVRAYLLTGVAKYKNTAKKNFDGMFKRADCYGNDLLQWKHNSGQGTNSCINGPAAVCACYLAIAQADTSYYQKARKTYMAERRTLFEMSNGKPTGKVWDSYDQASGNYNYWASTYNQGTNLGAAIMLYNHYGEKMFKDDADAIIKWSEANMANSQGLIHVCQTVRGDLCGFKGIMLRYLRMYAESFNAPSHYAWIAKNAYHAWNNRNSSGITSSAWLTKAEENFRHKEGDEYKEFGNEGNMTCVSAAFNCHLGAVDEHDAYAKNEAEDFNFIQNAPVTYEENGDEDNGGMVGPMKSKYYIGYRRVDFGDKPASHIELRAKTNLTSANINVYLDQPNATNGILLCTINGSELSALKTWDTIQKMINYPVTGIHNLYFVSSGAGQTNLNWWQFHSLNNVYADLTNGNGELTASFESDDLSRQLLIDGDLTTALTSGIEAGAETWIAYKSSSPMHICGYQVFSGDDAEGNPTGWALQGSDDGEKWETLHEVSDTAFSVHGQCYRAEVETSKDFTQYRLLFHLSETQTKLSVSEWQLLGRFIDENDLTADGGRIGGLSQAEDISTLIDHEGATPFPTPFSAQYFPNGNYRLSAYSITIDDSSKAPTSWKLEGTENGTTWKVIDQQTEAIFPHDGCTNIYRVHPETSCIYYKLTIQDEDAQITQWQLFGNYDFGHYYTDVTGLATIVSSDNSDALPLFDKDGNTYASLEGDNLYWSITTPVPVRVVGYSLVSADDDELDPHEITLFGYDDEGTETAIFTKALNFPTRGSRLTYSTSPTKSFKQFKLKVNEANGTSVRLADFELYGTAIAESDNPILIAPTTVDASAPALANSEAIGRINDGNRLYHYRAAFDEPVSVTYTLSDTVCVNAYSITASKSEQTRDPASWRLEGSKDGDNWTLLDTRSDETFSHRYATQFYFLNTTEVYNIYRLTVTAVNGGNQLQIGELQLLSVKPYDPNGVRDIKESKSLDGPIYNLAGQRLSKLQKGINIVNGRKIAIK